MGGVGPISFHYVTLNTSLREYTDDILANLDIDRTRALNSVRKYLVTLRAQCACIHDLYGIKPLYLH